MEYKCLKEIFQELKRTSPREDLTAHIIFTEDSFIKEYSLLSRTYRVSSDNKGFYPHMFSRSIFAYCLDGSDQGVRLDWYMEEEGNPGGWKVQDCYVLEQMRDAEAIADLTRIELEDDTICYGFGSSNTCIRVCETNDNGKIRLEPLAGNQMIDGKWVDLSIDRIYGYCTLLERQLNKEAGERMAKKRNRGRRRAPNPDKFCDPGICDCCLYVGEGDFLCDKHMEIVVSDWEPTENYLMCKGSNRYERA